MRLAFALFLAFLLFSSAAVADQPDDGLAAYNRGDYQTAFKIWQVLADQGNADAQYNLGELYFKGEGVRQDYVEAARWFRSAAGKGDTDSQSMLGVLYFNGWGVKQDYVDAAHWFRKAADHGSTRAQAVLGTMYLRGQGVEKDYAEAKKLFQNAADQGDQSSQKILQNWQSLLAVPQSTSGTVTPIDNNSWDKAPLAPIPESTKEHEWWKSSPPVDKPQQSVADKMMEHGIGRALAVVILLIAWRVYLWLVERIWLAGVYLAKFFKSSKSTTNGTEGRDTVDVSSAPLNNNISSSSDIPKQGAPLHIKVLVFLTCCALVLLLFLQFDPHNHFGPNNYEECILESMKGVGSDQAAGAIQRACRTQFPRWKEVPTVP